MFNPKMKGEKSKNGRTDLFCIIAKVIQQG
jgi:hypothetical protein